MRKLTRLPNKVKPQPIYNPSVNRVLSNNRRERIVSPKPIVPPKPIVDVDVYTVSNNLFVEEYKWTLPLKKVIFGKIPISYNNWTFNLAQEINCKILPPNYLDKKFSLYVGGSTYIDVENILKTINYQEYDLIVFKSSKINCIYKDASISSKLYFDVSENIDKQIQDYRSAGYPENNELLETDIIFRSKTETMNLVNNLWLKEMQKYKGTPDVYGFNYAVFKFKPRCLIL